MNHKVCIEDAILNAELICKDNGIRFTAIRRKVFELIWKSHNPIKAYDILDFLQEENAAARPTTVYRSIDFLIENGLIHKLNRLSAYVGCAHPRKHNDCYFLICSSCGDITECCDSKITEIIIGSSSNLNFKTKNVTLEIEGICQNCN